MPERKEELIPVLLYHSVSDSPAPEIADFAVSSDEFSRQVELVANSGRDPINFSELGARMAAGDPSALRNVVCVTFDDGWADNIAAAATLESHGVPATIFVTSGFVGHEGYLTTSELEALARSPMIEIGAHSVTHPRLDELDAVEVAGELTQSRRDLEKTTGRPVGSFAYPHGNYDRRVLRAAKEAGFGCAAAVKNALSHPGDDPFAVARWTITSSSDSDEIRSVLDGTGAPVAWRGERLRTRGYRTYRRMKRRLRT